MYRGYCQMVEAIIDTAERTDQLGKAVLLQLGHIGLLCQRGDVDSQGVCDCRDQVGGRAPGPALDLVEEAVREGNTIGQLPLGEVGQFPFTPDTRACVVVVERGHNGLRS